MERHSGPADLASGRRLGRVEGIRLAIRRLRERIWITESHMWCELELPPSHRGASLPDGLRLVRVQEDEVQRLTGRGKHARWARERLRHATEWWIVLDHANEVVFSCWVFHAPVPVPAARTGFLPLPEFVACVVDPVAARADGYDVAPAAWCAIASELAAWGVACLIARVERDDVGLQDALTRAGFRPYAVEHHRRRGSWRKVTVETDGGPAGAYLVAALPAEARTPDPAAPRGARAVWPATALRR